MKRQESNRSVEELRQKRRDIEHWYEKEKRQQHSSKRNIYYSDDDKSDNNAWTGDSSISTKETSKGSSTTTSSRSGSSSKKKQEKKNKERERRISSSLPDKVEYSIRKARAILLEGDTTTKKVKTISDKRALEKVHIAMYTDINELVRVLEEDRRKMEYRIKVAQEESARLKMENKSAAEKIDSLEESKVERESRLIKEKTNMGIVRSGSFAKLNDTESENKSISKEINSMRREKEEMALMLARLAETKSQLETQLIKTEVENTKLQSDVDSSGRKLVELEAETSKMHQKVSGIDCELQEHQRQAQQFASSWDDHSIRPKSTTLGTIPSQASIHFGHDEKSEEELMKEQIAELAAQKRALETQLEAEEEEGDGGADCEAGLEPPPPPSQPDLLDQTSKPQLNSWLNFDFEPQRSDDDDDDSTFGFISLSSKGSSLKSAKKPLKRISHK